MKVKTTRFGEIDVPEGDVIHLPSGLIGFPELKQYVLLDHDKDSPFKWFQSLEDGAIAFVLIDPLLFNPEYVAEVTDAELAELDVQTEEDLVISVIVTVPSQLDLALLAGPAVPATVTRTSRASGQTEARAAAATADGSALDRQ